MAERAELAGPVVSAGTGLHRHQAARLACEEAQHLIAPKLLAEHHAASGVSAERLENALRQIETDRRNLAHGRLLRVVLQHLHSGTSMPSGGVHPIANGAIRLRSAP